MLYLYDNACALNLAEVKKFVRETFAIPVVVRKCPEVVKTRGLILDVPLTQKSWLKAVGGKPSPDSFSIIITRRLFATLDSSDRRPHLRSSLFSYPAIISLSGIVEGPAKPREYYLAKQGLAGSGLWPLEEARIKQRLKSCFIDYGDCRIIEVLKGLAAQAIFFWRTGFPFCRHKLCRLYNAHWQEELIYAQVKSARFCRRHSRQLERLRLRA